MVRGRELGRNTICRALWPDEPASTSSRNRLSVTTYLLRKECQAHGVPLGVFIRSDRSTLTMDTEVTSDYDDFMAAGHAMRSEQSPQAKAEHARRIVELYKCPLCEGIESPWLVALRSDARQTFQDAVMTLVQTQSAADAVETVRHAVMVDLDAEGAVGTFLRWMAAKGAWEAVDDLLWRLESASSSRARRMAAEFRKSAADSRPRNPNDWTDRPTLAVCVVDAPARDSLKKHRGKGPAREDFVLLANPVTAEETAKEILTEVPGAKVSLHLVVMDPSDDLPDYVRRQHKEAMAGKLWLSACVEGLILETRKAYGQDDHREASPSA